MPTNENFSGVSNCYVFKSRLQEYAQKVGLPTPAYDTVKEGPSHQPYFRSTVIVDNVRYNSLPGFFNRKAAEQSAAEVALLELSKSGKINHSISQPVHETGLCKNLLQEYAQKMNYAIPIYQSEKEEAPGRTPHFKCTVEIGGIHYIGASARTKKEAEIKAARTALLAIQSSTSETYNTQYSEFSVIPSKKRGGETHNVQEEAANVPKAKKARFRKRVSKKKLSGAKLDVARNEVSVDSVVICGQLALESDQTEGCSTEGTGCGSLAETRTENFQGENLMTDLNEDENSDVKDALRWEPESGQLASLGSIQVDHGQPGLELDQTDGTAIEVAGCGSLAVSRTGKLEGERLFTDLNEKENSDRKGTLSSLLSCDPESEQLASLDSIQIDHGQSGLELDQTDGTAVEGAGCESVAVSRTGNFQGERLFTGLSKKENSDRKDTWSSLLSCDPESGQLASLDSIQIDHDQSGLEIVQTEGSSIVGAGCGPLAVNGTEKFQGEMSVTDLNEREFQ